MIIKVTINKILSIILIAGSIGYYIPKTLDMMGWLDSGVINGYFYMLAPINFLIIGLGIVSLLSFMKTHNRTKTNLLLTANIIGVTIMIFWYLFISTS